MGLPRSGGNRLENRRDRESGRMGRAGRGGSANGQGQLPAGGERFIRQMVGEQDRFLQDRELTGDAINSVALLDNIPDLLAVILQSIGCRILG